MTSLKLIDNIISKVSAVLDSEDCGLSEEKQSTCPVKYNVDKWVKENESDFKPPICNKLMHNGQLNIMFVGGPNVRKDYHIDCGEEFFYMMKGNMNLPTFQQGKKKLVSIKEGECYLLRGCVPHSPQRPEKNSLGLVVERKRVKPEMDALRFYVNDFDKSEKDDTKILWEHWFFCTNLGTQLVPVVKKFQSSKEFKSHKVGDNVSANPPVKLNETVCIPDPIDLFSWIDKNKKELQKNKEINLYSGTQTTVKIITGPFEVKRKFHQETWIYVLKGGTCQLSFPNINRNDETLGDGDCLIINPNQDYTLSVDSSEALVMSVTMDIK